MSLIGVALVSNVSLVTAKEDKGKAVLAINIAAKDILHTLQC